LCQTWAVTNNASPAARRVSVPERGSSRTPESYRKNEPLVATLVAELHYNEGMSNSAIADRLGISRFRVARLLDFALSTGIVTIQVKAPVALDAVLSRQLRERFHLAEALVVPNNPITNVTAPLSAVGAVAAQFVAELVNERARIGIAWGKTVSAFAVASRQFRFPTCDAVQLLGNLPTLQGSMHAGDVLRAFADSLGGEIYPLHASLILPDEQTARGVRNEASTRLTMATYARLDVAILGVGSWDPPSSQLHDVLPPEDLAQIRALNPTADVCANLFDANGRQITGEFSKRTIGISREEMEKVPMAVLLATGKKKATALRATLRAGFVNAVVTDADIATALLR
jgi:DNA-binding transcriptional regulator LsrR (DeoR family)